MNTRRLFAAFRTFGPTLLITTMIPTGVVLGGTACALLGLTPSDPQSNLVFVPVFLAWVAGSIGTASLAD
jgi:hypothetical protein